MKPESLPHGLALCTRTLSGQASTEHSADGPPSEPSAIPLNGMGDFDFLMGHWRVENRRRLKPLSGTEEWESFAATQHAQKLPAGIGNYDEFAPRGWRPGFVGLSFRVYNPQTSLWSIYWLNNQDGGIDKETGALTAPVVGRFQDGVGRFEARDQFNGRPIRVRYTWSHVAADTARWEQAFSPDDGATWEINWTMDFTRG